MNFDKDQPAFAVDERRLQDYLTRFGSSSGEISPVPLVQLLNSAADVSMEITANLSRLTELLGSDYVFPPSTVIESYSALCQTTAELDALGSRR
jgi:hypothetical protein